MVAADSALGPAPGAAPPTDSNGYSVPSERLSVGGAPLLRLHLTAAERLAAARLVVNEDSRPLRPASDGGTAGQATEDTWAILQTVRGFARFAHRSHSYALAALGPHVAGHRVPTQRRHAVYRGLPAFGAARPPLWLDALYGPWGAYSGNWSVFRDAVLEGIRHGFDPPCDRDPIAWGNAADARIAESRGLVRLACGERNGFWAKPAAVVDARDASGRGQR
jgi:hypothetical protein